MKTEYVIKDAYGLVFGIFESRHDRDYALKHYVKLGFPGEQSRW